MCVYECARVCGFLKCFIVKALTATSMELEKLSGTVSRSGSVAIQAKSGSM